MPEKSFFPIIYYINFGCFFLTKADAYFTIQLIN